MAEIEGEIRKIEGRETDDGQTYKRVQVDNKWGSFWGSTKNIEEGLKVKAEYEDVKDGRFTNWKKFKPLDQSDEKDEKKESSKQSSQKGNFKNAKRRFEIRKQVALKAAVNMGEVTIAQVKQAYPVFVNLLSKQPVDFGNFKEEDSDGS